MNAYPVFKQKVIKVDRDTSLMGDFEDVEEIAVRLEMNPREKARYEEHIEGIKKYSVKVKFWRFWNFIWQLIFFWGIVIIAIETGQRISETYLPSIYPMFDYFSIITSPMAIVVGILGPFSFFIMIWTGIVKAKWEGKLTRASAYALSFLSNIEHREYMELEERGTKLKEIAVEEDAKDKGAESAMHDKLVMLKTAYDEGRMNQELYRKNLEKLEAEYKTKLEE